MAVLVPWVSRQNSSLRGLDAQNVKCPTEQAMKWWLYFDKLDRKHPDGVWQEWGMFLLEWLFCTASTMRKMEQQCFRQSCYPQAIAAVDNDPMQPSVWILLGSMNEDNLRVAKDIYHGQYLLALSILTCQCHNLLVQNLYNELDWMLVRADFHSTTCSGRSQSTGRVHSHAPPWTPSSSQAQSQSPETSRHEGTTAPQ